MAHLVGEQAPHRSGRGRRPGAVPFRQYLGALSLAEYRKLTQPLAGVVADSREEQPEAAGEVAGGGGGEQVRVVAEVDVQLGVVVGAHDQGEVGGVIGMGAADGQAGCGGGVLEGVVLEDDHAVEQVGGGRQVAPGLQLGEGNMVEGARAGLLDLQVVQPGQQVLPAADVSSGGNGVDEHPDHVLGAGQLGGPTGDGGTEDDVAFAAVAGQQQGPGALDDGVEGQAVLPGHVLQACGLLRRKGGVGAAGRLGPVGFGDCVVVGQRRGRVEAGQELAPVLLGVLLVLVAQPPQVLAVGAAAGSRGGRPPVMAA